MKFILRGVVSLALLVVQACSTQSEPPSTAARQTSSSEFKLSPSADAAGTSLDSYLDIAPSDLKQAFGKPAAGSDPESLGEYAFTNQRGEVFTVYALMQDAPEFVIAARKPTFWSSGKPYSFHIGSNGGNTSAFKTWLLSETGKAR